MPSFVLVCVAKSILCDVMVSAAILSPVTAPSLRFGVPIVPRAIFEFESSTDVSELSAPVIAPLATRLLVISPALSVACFPFNALVIILFCTGFSDVVERAESIVGVVPSYTVAVVVPPASVIVIVALPVPWVTVAVGLYPAGPSGPAGPCGPSNWVPCPFGGKAVPVQTYNLPSACTK